MVTATNMISTVGTRGGVVNRKPLRLGDLARILGQERLRAGLIRSGMKPADITPQMLEDAPPLKDSTMRQYLKVARYVRDGVPVRQQYIDNPFPLPSNEDEASRGHFTPVWEPPGLQENRVRQWYRRRPGPGFGGGRKPAER